MRRKGLRVASFLKQALTRSVFKAKQGFRLCGTCESSEASRTSLDDPQRRRDDFRVARSASVKIFAQDPAFLPSRPVSSSFLVAENGLDRKSTRLNSSHGYISYAVFCLKKKK